MKTDKELIMIGLELDTKEEVLKAMGNRLREAGYVTDDFVASVLEREYIYPTGLPTLPYAIAIPHTDTDKVIESRIAFATLKDSVTFSVMGNSDTEIDVKIIFMLALNNPNKQLKTLQNLTNVFQNEEMVDKLGNVQSIEECERLFSAFE